jgi:hypothetical protein
MGATMTMPFGKYWGWVLDAVPTDSLECLVQIPAVLQGRLRTAVLDELDTRAYGRERDHYGRWQDSTPQRGASATAASNIRPDQIGLARDAFDRGFRAAALTHHPVVGGNPGTMARLNALAESVRSQLQVVGGPR